MVFSSSKRTLALAGFAADRRKRGFSVALSPGDRASPSVLEETASVRSRLLSRPRAGSLQGGSRRRTPTRRRLAVERKAHFLTIVRHDRNMPHEFGSVLLSTRRRGPQRLLPLACRPATDTSSFVWLSCPRGLPSPAALPCAPLCFRGFGEWAVLVPLFKHTGVLVRLRLRLHLRLRLLLRLRTAASWLAGDLAWLLVGAAAKCPSLGGGRRGDEAAQGDRGEGGGGGGARAAASSGS